MKFLLMIALGFLSLVSMGQSAKTTKITEDIEIRKLSGKVYLYTAWADMGRWGRVGSNGLIVIEGGRAFLVDTAPSATQTAQLVDWLDKTMNVKIKAFVPGHWHEDCTGGMQYLNGLGVETHALQQTNRILASKGLPQAGQSFSDSLLLHLGTVEVKCHYLGGGHATDNIVVWIPSERVLFGGCMLKDLSATGLGNTADAASVMEWLQTIEKVDRKFPQATLIVPGHGKPGGREILDYTKQLLIEQR